MKTLMKNLPSPVTCGIFGADAVLLALWMAADNRIVALAWAGIGVAWIFLAAGFLETQTEGHYGKPVGATIINPAKTSKKALRLWGAPFVCSLCVRRRML